MLDQYRQTHTHTHTQQRLYMIITM